MASRGSRGSSPNETSFTTKDESLNGIFTQYLALSSQRRKNTIMVFAQKNE
ncbi:hypothetical protein FDUTEX481_08154 [Tolypothrix sp. PCC 7601]|nr:hypothetical protein FDUTEX481_08154 [Tolypothrix sp. PCC 7601]